jgi:hypothetical protein
MQSAPGIASSSKKLELYPQTGVETLLMSASNL